MVTITTIVLTSACANYESYCHPLYSWEMLLVLALSLVAFGGAAAALMWSGGGSASDSRG